MIKVTKKITKITTKNCYKKYFTKTMIINIITIKAQAIIMAIMLMIPVIRTTFTFCIADALNNFHPKVIHHMIHYRT